MGGNNFGTCRSCGQRIIWIRTSAGKSMPCNPEIVTYRIPEEGKGRERVVTQNGEVHSAELVQAGASDATGVGYISHFATCPNADQHRRRK